MPSGCSPWAPSTGSDMRARRNTHARTSTHMHTRRTHALACARIHTCTRARTHTSLPWSATQRPLRKAWLRRERTDARRDRAEQNALRDRAEQSARRQAEQSARRDRAEQSADRAVGYNMPACMTLHTGVTRRRVDARRDRALPVLIAIGRCPRPSRWTDSAPVAADPPCEPPSGCSP